MKIKTSTNMSKIHIKNNYNKYYLDKDKKK